MCNGHHSNQTFIYNTELDEWINEYLSDYPYLSDSIYAMDKDLKAWALVGHLKEARFGHTITLIE